MTEPPWSFWSAPTPTCLPAHTHHHEEESAIVSHGARARETLTQVDVAGNGRSADVEPVGVVRSELLAGAGLDNVNPDGDLELACHTRGGGGNQSRSSFRCRGLFAFPSRELQEVGEARPTTDRPVHDSPTTRFHTEMEPRNAHDRHFEVSRCNRSPRVPNAAKRKRSTWYERDRHALSGHLRC